MKEGARQARNSFLSENPRRAPSARCCSSGRLFGRLGAKMFGVLLGFYNMIWDNSFRARTPSIPSLAIRNRPDFSALLGSPQRGNAESERARIRQRAAELP